MYTVLLFAVCHKSSCECCLLWLIDMLPCANNMFSVGQQSSRCDRSFYWLIKFHWSHCTLNVKFDWSREEQTCPTFDLNFALTYTEHVVWGTCQCIVESMQTFKIQLAVCLTAKSTFCRHTETVWYQHCFLGISIEMLRVDIFVSIGGNSFNWGGYSWLWACRGTAEETGRFC